MTEADLDVLLVSWGGVNGGRSRPIKNQTRSVEFTEPRHR